MRVSPAPVHDGRVHVGGGECVWLIQEGDHGQQDCAHVLCWIPSFAGQFTALGIVDWRVQDRYAEVSVLRVEISQNFSDWSNIRNYWLGYGLYVNINEIMISIALLLQSHFKLLQLKLETATLN